MIDRKLEQAIVDIQEFIVLWNNFFHVLEEASRSEDTLGWDEQKDTEFLKMKAQIAYRKQVLLDSLGKEDFNMAGDIKKVLAMCPSLDILSGESPIKINTIRGLWHEVFIALNKFVGQLKQRRDAIAHVSYFSFRMNAILKSKALRYSVIGVVAAIILGALAMVIPFEELFTRTQGLFGR
ncbi:MAG TPA: hypothetical protein PKH07_10610 [bacterium]|nr:hypothetical protein [bacterium]